MQVEEVEALILIHVLGSVVVEAAGKVVAEYTAILQLL